MTIDRGRLVGADDRGEPAKAGRGVPGRRGTSGSIKRGGGWRRVRRAAALLLVASLTATCGATLRGPSGPDWASPGLVGGGGWPFAGEPLSPVDAYGAAYLPDSSVVRLADGRVRLIPFGSDTPITVDASDPRVAAAVRSDKAWLARGTVPGANAPLPGDGLLPNAAPTGSAPPSPGVTGSGAAVARPEAAGSISPDTRAVYREMAARALLDLRLLTRPNGASLASWYDKWRYSWPRDSAFAVAAFAVTGHQAEARRVLRFLARVQNENGLWAARYNPDGSAVVDGRPPQLDSLGWVLWASWFFRTQSPTATTDLPEFWPMVSRAADRLARSLDVEGLPPPSSDYWERDHASEQDPRRPTLGVVAPVLAGLRSAAALARDLGRTQQAARWQRATHRLSDAVARQFTPHGYPRSPIAGGRMDTSVTFLAPPFAPVDPGVSAAVRNAFDRQELSNGGVLPGERWAGDKKVAWTPEMGMFTLASAASGRKDEALARLDWLAAHRTSLGVLPEKVDEDGKPAGVAPLGWTAATVILSLSALERPLPIPNPS
ncbi:glycoside hydrolase family 15 protein [Spirillospora sp. NPDC048911]|uniref:glycoside hydrolase family 15 protein n=1 Tax=Spirillospora sp. NPDC048911 TaxID=3364527 RepID=UPI00370FF7A0